MTVPVWIWGSAQASPGSPQLLAWVQALATNARLKVELVHADV